MIVTSDDYDFACLRNVACAAARRAIGTRNGEHEI